MENLLSYALLGIGAGAIYGLLAQGIVIVYRSSGVVNLAQGALAMTGAYMFYEFRDQAGMPGAVAIALATLGSGVLGLIIYALVFRPLRTSTPLARLIASLGLLLALESAASLTYGSGGMLIPSSLPINTVEVLPGTFVGIDLLLVFAIALAVTTGLWAVYRYLSFGRQTTAVAESAETAAGLGHSPDWIAARNWVLATGLAGLSGSLIAPITGLNPTQLSELVVPALAAALASTFVSFPLAFLAGVLIGIAESEVGQYVNNPGWQTAVPLIAVSLLLVVRGQRYPGRGVVLDRLPAVGRVSGRQRGAVAVVVALILLSQIGPSSWVLPLTVTVTTAVLGLSVVVVTGLAGQLSLVTYGLAGTGAMAAALIDTRWEWGFVPSMIGGAIVAGVAGLVIGVPSLRTRGASLAIITLGAGVVISGVVLSISSLTNYGEGIDLGTRSIFGWNVSGLLYPRRYALVVVVVFGLLYLMTRNLRRSHTGKRLLALRSNETAAASAGISVGTAKLYAFTLAAAIAGIGGVLLTFGSDVVVLTQFDIFASLTVAGLVVMGSVGYPAGALIAGCLVSGGVLTSILDQWGTIDSYIPLIGGIGVILTVLGQPDGLAAKALHLLRRAKLPFRAKTADPLVLPAAHGTTASGEKVQAKQLVVNGLTVKYSGAFALRDVSLTVAPGQIVGLIGPNGAGKTSFIDAVTGLVPCDGDVLLGRHHVASFSPNRRCRLGLTRSFQGVQLFEDLTVLENIAVGARPRRWSGILDLLWPRETPLSATAARAVRVLSLEDCLGSMPSELSFGRRRLVGIARALSSGPSVVLLDEPGAGLDVTELDELGELIRYLARELGIGVVLVEHHLEMVMKLCDEIVVLTSGQVLAQGTPQEITGNEHVVSAYIGSVSAGDLTGELL